MVYKCRGQDKYLTNCPSDENFESVSGCPFVGAVPINVSSSVYVSQTP